MAKDELQLDSAEETVEETVEVAAQAEEKTQEAEPDWKAEAAKWRAIAERNKKKVETKEEPVAKAQEAPKGDLSISDFLSLRKEKYSDEEIATIADEASKLGVPVAKVLSNPTFKAGIEYMRNKAKIEQATPAPSGRAQAIKPAKPLGQMTDGERNEWFEKLKQNRVSSSE